mgnify:FL=1
MRYFHVKNGFIVNIVDYPYVPPPVSDEDEDIVLDPTGTVSVGDPFDVLPTVRERRFTALERVLVQELLRLTNEVRALQTPPRAPLTADEYKTWIKDRL